ncbi:MAG: ABC transporter substrate-binding protein [Acidobacteria bacterium SCN 69-37]|nr:MAG: ABC transporter substrate-binding protein [Acidobacteria bacterium SCN 69-37]
MKTRTIRLGAGAGYAGDRIEPAIELAARGALDYLIFECLAERTIGLAQQARAANPDTGFDPLLGDRFRAVLPACRAQAVRIITNMGAANPVGAAAVVRDLAREMGLNGLRVAAVTGDDVLAEVARGHYVLDETGEASAALGDRLVSANAYIGAAPIVQALTEGADVVITGRAADPALFLAPLVHAFAWADDDWTRLGAGTVVGHLLECAGQVTGGYFADPGVKDVPDLARLGFPLAEVHADGTAVITKVAGSGGRVTRATCKEQLLYEIHDPSAYLTPDVTADFTRVRLDDDGEDRVRVTGGTGRARPDTLKVSVGYRDGYIGEGQISYAGAGAVARARLAGDIVTTRLGLAGVDVAELRRDLIGIDALHGAVAAGRSGDPYEVRLRVAARTRTAGDARRVANEVESLYTNGPAGGGGATIAVREVLAVASTFMPRDRVRCRVVIEEA